MKAARHSKYDPKLNAGPKIDDVRPPTVSAPDTVIGKVGAAGLGRTDRNYRR